MEINEKYFMPFVVVALIVGVILGGSLFSQTEYIDDPNYDEHNFCYEVDQAIYVANSLSYIPDGTFGSSNCLVANPSYSECYIVEVCPTCETHKVTCVCKK